LTPIEVRNAERKMQGGKSEIETGTV